MLHLSIQASGMVTALGYSAPATLAAIRAGISAVGTVPWTDFESGERLRGAKVSLPHWWEGVGKLAELLAPAIHECLSETPRIDPTAVPLLIGVADKSRAGRPARLDEQLLAELQARLEFPLHPRSGLFPADQIGTIHALHLAQDLIRTRVCDVAIVAGVDSFLQQQMLDACIEDRRLNTPSNSNGFFPGEAAAAVLVADMAAADRRSLRIVGAGSAREPAPIMSTNAFRAQGLTAAVAEALSSARLEMHQVAWRLTDLSGEHYGFKEAAMVAGRFGGGPRKVALDLWHPIEFLGEIGAAILPCLLAQAHHAFLHGYAPGRIALCHIGNDAGDRAALLLTCESLDGAPG